MRVTSTELSGEFERPSGWFWNAVPAPTEATVLRLDPGFGVAALRVCGPRGRCGVGVWELGTGRARWAHDWADNVRILASGSVLACGKQRLGRYSWPEMTLVDEVRAHEYADGLVVSPSERLIVTWLNDGQGANGYEVFALDGEIMTLGPMCCWPVFSPAERWLACSPGTGGTWWTPTEEDWPADFAEEAEIPSPGGVVTFARLILHDIERNMVSRHRLQFNLEPGWVPADVWNDRWRYGAIGLRFQTEDQIEVVLPDGCAAWLRLPLPETVLLPTPSRQLPASS